ncbi:hypothetical protein E2C01_016179 [Portunus trituberculatus]|uniref:Uncharacterized protein n=1 Tax=Portunus trituberculatus TaxID=210409 RepID=A0A5B7DNQ5_PORTR|nr:hypothetical protein [Portunus trituberculatus]
MCEAEGSDSCVSRQRNFRDAFVTLAGEVNHHVFCHSLGFPSRPRLPRLTGSCSIRLCCRGWDRNFCWGVIMAKCCAPPACQPPARPDPPIAQPGRSRLRQDRMVLPTSRRPHSLRLQHLDPAPRCNPCSVPPAGTYHNTPVFWTSSCLETSSLQLVHQQP